MFADYSDSEGSDSDSEYKNTRRGTAQKKLKKKAVAEDDEDEIQADNIADHDGQSDDEGEGPPVAATEEAAKDDEESDYINHIQQNPYANYKKVFKYLDPSENMTINKLSRYDYADLVSIETQRIENDGHVFIKPGNLDRADLIAEATINARKCPYKVVRKVGHKLDHANKLHIILCEVHDPNEMMFSRLNATNMM